MVFLNCLIVRVLLHRYPFNNPSYRFIGWETTESLIDSQNEHVYCKLDMRIAKMHNKLFWYYY